MKRIKLLFKNHWQLLVIEAAIILIYGLASYYIDKNPVGNFTMLSIIFSNEFFVAILVAIGAIYSWFASKADYEYNKNLEMLKDIDKIHDYYQDKDSFPDVVKSCQGHINELKKIEKYKGTFLYTYLSYIEHKNGQHKKEEEQFDEQSEKTFIKNQTDTSYTEKRSLSSIKNEIGKELSINKEYIKYSRNYKDEGFWWSTWYSLDENLIDNIPDDNVILFFTSVNGQYKGVKIKGNQLKKLSKNMKASNSKTGNKTYDFYIRLKREDNTYHECRNDIPLSKYEIEEVDLNFLNKE